jgi:CheY-like chemotaxis protein
VVDDEEDVRQAICDILAFAGCEPVGASNGREALERLRERDFDLVVTDLQMPIMDGWQLIAAIRRDPDRAQLPIVVVSAETERPVPTTYVLNKPFEIRSLILLIGRVIALPRSMNSAA